MNKDFLVTVYFEEQMVTQSLNHLKNSMNLTALEKKIPRKLLDLFDNSGEEIVFLTEKLRSLDYKSRGSIVLDPPYSVIKHGDFQVFSSDEKSYRFLFIDPEKIVAGFKEFAVSPGQIVRIGSGPDNEIIFDLNALIDPEAHLVFKKLSNGKAMIEDKHKESGLFINKKLESKKELQLFDEIFFLGLSMVYLGNSLSISLMNMKTSLIEQKEESKFEEIIPFQKEYFKASPRILPSYDLSSLEIDFPPSKQTFIRPSALLKYGPSITMALITMTSAGAMLTSAFEKNNTAMMVSSGILAFSSLATSLLWPSLQDRYAKKTIDLKEEKRIKKYNEYIEKIDQSLSERTREIKNKLNTLSYPQSEILYEFFNNPDMKKHIWERSREDEDFLHVRLGQGMQSFPAEIRIKKQGFSLEEDELLELPIRLKDRYSKLDNMPIVLDLVKNDQIGLIGNEEAVNQTLQRIILNIIALHSPSDVKIVVLSHEESSEFFEGYLNVPHLWNNEKNFRFFSRNEQEVHSVLKNIDEVFQQRREERKENNYEGMFTPYFIFLVMEPQILEEESFFRSFKEENLGFTTIYAFKEFDLLPKRAKTIIQTSLSGTNGFYVKNENGNRPLIYQPDYYNRQKQEDFINQISSLTLKRDASSLSIPERVSFLEVLRSGNIEQFNLEEHWKNNNSHNSLAVPIGLKAGSEVFELDIHEKYHGAHGLVAGTTGSGKSEFLQALILSLASHYSPNEIGFVLIDFKGGDMARPFTAKKERSALPHLSATISNLSGNILQRALISLQAEINKREDLFNQTAKEIGIDKIDINSYHRYFKEGRIKEPLPHLVIVIDEFAQLKTKNEEFLDQLKDIAQVGRSLGIHLILATQKPDGIVDPQILSNSRFRICLKVAQRDDSMAVINRPDAARIKTPGRFYLQVGFDELFEQIQAGYTGSLYRPTPQFIPEEELTLQVIDDTATPIYQAKLNLTTETSEATEMERIVNAMSTLGDRLNLKVKPLWMDLLKERIDLTQVPVNQKGLATASIGLVDLINTQEQRPWQHDFIKDGSLILYGQPRSGKTTAIQNILYSIIVIEKYKPSEVQFTILDFRGRTFDYLKDSPYIKGIVHSDDSQAISESFDRIEEMIEERKMLFSSKGVPNYQSFKETYPNHFLEAEILIINGYGDLYNEFYKEHERLVQIASLAQTYGIALLVSTSSKSDLPSKLKQYFNVKIVLQMASKDDYYDIFEKRSRIYPEAIAGRGLIAYGNDLVEIQLAIPHSEIEFEAKRIKAIQQDLMSSKNKELVPKVQREIQSKLETHPKKIERATSTSILKTNLYKRLSPLSGHNGLILACSPSESLKYGLKKDEGFRISLLSQDKERNRLFFRYLVPRISQNNPRAKILFVDNFSNSDEFFKDLSFNGLYANDMENLDPIIFQIKDEVNGRKNQEASKEDPVIVIIEDFSNFFDSIADKQANFFRIALKMLEKEKLNIYFITGFDACDHGSIDPLFMNLLVYSEAKIIDENSFDMIKERIENIPLLSESQKKRPQLFIKDCLSEISWIK